MAKILIAEDDEFMREILTEYLSGKGHAITAVADGQAACAVVLESKFDLVISDIKMPSMNGVELLAWLRARSPVPFILMTGFTSLIETKRAAELGAQGFLSKPFANQELADLVEQLLSPPPPPTAGDVERMDAEYRKISIDDFVARPKIDVDVYIRLAGAKYLKIAQLGGTLDVRRLLHYKEKGIFHLHVRAAEPGLGSSASSGGA